MAAQRASEMRAFLTVGLSDDESDLPAREARWQDIVRRARQVRGRRGQAASPRIPAAELRDALSLSAVATEERETMNRVTGKVAVVTGAARGLGRADAQLLAHEGARVIATDIDVAAGESLAAIPGVEFLKLDVRREEEWERVVAQTLNRHGRLDVLVNNAGVIHVGDPVELDMEEWRHMFAVNVEGTMLGCKHALPAMVRGGSGSIINLSSIAARSGLYFYAGYCATKGAIAAYTKAVAVYCAQNRLNIRCNSIHPGGIDTPINAGLAEEMTVKLPRMRIPPQSPVSEDGPKMRYGEPNDVAWMVVYLASDESKFVNGSELWIDNTASITAAAVP